MTSTPGTRIGAVLKEFYNGDVMRMVVDLGLDRSTAYRYLKEKANPSRTVLILLALRANVKLQWLQTGPTDAVQWEEQSSSTAIGDLGLPVLRAPAAEVPAPGSPEHTGMLVAPAPIYYASNRYWVRIVEDRADLQIMRGDLILVDPCQPRPPVKEDVGRVFAMCRSKRNVVAAISSHDLDKEKGSLSIYGVALILQRDLQE